MEMHERTNISVIQFSFLCEDFYATYSCFMLLDAKSEMYTMQTKALLIMDSKGSPKERITWG